MATFTALTLIWVFAVPPFLPADESAHTDYAMQVTHGHLPIAGQPFHAEFPQLGQRTLRQHVSNHPPLYYVFAGPVLRIGAFVGRPLVGILAARGLTAIFGLVAVGLAAVLAGLVARSASRRARAQLMIVAAGLTATIPSFIAASGAIQNDSLTILFTMAALSLLAWVVRCGATRRRIAALAICCTAGMLSRSTFIQVLLVVLITVFVVAIWPQDGKILPLQRDRVKTGLLQVVVIGGVSFLGAGWFYILNKHRYGDFVGANAVNKLVAGRALEPGATSLFSFFTYPRTWWIQIVQLSGGYGELRLRQPATIEHLSTVLAVILCASVAAVLFSIARGRQWNDRRGWLLVAGLFVVLAISFAEIAVHATQHGSENNRYLLDGIAFWGVGVGGALLLLGFRRLPLIPLAVMVLGSIGALRYTLFIARRQPILAGRGWFDALATSMAHVGLPGARAILGLFIALLVAGLLAQAIALVWLGNRVVDDPVTKPAPKHAAQEASA
jgi:4-amino-4-deoxy-L-arabinose transferase-like glycosyltransferase